MLLSNFIILQFYLVKGKNNNNRLHYMIAFQNNLICNIFTVYKYNLTKDLYMYIECHLEHLS